MILPAEIETAKRRYSSELAAYTLEQWRTARRLYLEAQQRTANGQPRTRSEGDDSQSSVTSDDGAPGHDDGHDPMHHAGPDLPIVKAVDFGNSRRSSEPATNGVIE